MGASTFTNIGLGRDARSAFATVVADERHYSGNGGYTGTIAEKDDFADFGKVARADARKLVDTWHALNQYAYDDTRPQLAKAIGQLPAYLQALNWQRIIAVADDKWGAAVCVELTGKAAADAKARRGRKGTRDRVFVFFGLASS